jgi:uncharacterized protein (TIGR02001 family)
MRLRLWTTLTVCLMPAVGAAETTANFGFVNDYIFRGVYQEDSSASAGLDFASDNGLYVGTWGADVGDGLETDLYFGYGGEAGAMSWGVGYTGYFYTDDFDDTYQELNLNLGVGLFSLDVAVGEWDGFGASQDYTFTSLTFQPEKGPYILLGGFSGDFDGEYLELGYTFDFEGIDLNVSALYSDDVDKPGSSILLSQDSPLAETALVFGISKTISLGGARGAGSVND